WPRIGYCRGAFPLWSASDGRNLCCRAIWLKLDRYLAPECNCGYFGGGGARKLNELAMEPRPRCGRLEKVSSCLSREDPASCDNPACDLSLRDRSPHQGDDPCGGHCRPYGFRDRKAGRRLGGNRHRAPHARFERSFAI